jgi:hypothetical protein
MKLLKAIPILVLMTSRMPSAKAQTPTGSIVRFEIENSTFYMYDCPYSQIGTVPNKLDHPVNATGIASGLGIGDIVSVNGSPVKGAAYEEFFAGFGGSPNPPPGHPILDGTRLAVAPWDLDFMNSDGTLIGIIHIDGLVGGARSPGAPQAITGSGMMVTGGSGAFLGVRGYFSGSQVPGAGERITSACEDPSLRRVFAEGKGKRHGVLYLIPATWPQVIATPNGPAVVHASDGSLVTAAKPAKSGEILTLYASGLGPTRPGVDPGQPFPASPPQVVNSPVQVLVNGDSIDALYAGGDPGAIDGYQVNFQMPNGIASGEASIQVSAAWISGPAVKIPIQ